MHILFATAELRGMVSIGGLSEMVFSLAGALCERGHDVRIIMPFYEYLNKQKKICGKNAIWKGKLDIGCLPDAEIFVTELIEDGYHFPLYLVKGHAWFMQADRAEKIYPSQDNPEPYFFLAAAILRFLADEKTEWCPDVIHAHDYHTGLIPVYLKTHHAGRIKNKKVKSFFTIHNLAFQGITHPDCLEYGGLPLYLKDYTPYFSGMECYGKINCMKGAIIYSDLCSTVSPTYAREIQTQEQGMGLDGVLAQKAREGKLRGILNGINNAVWDPQKLGAFAYDYDHLNGKSRAKTELRKLCGLDQSSDPVIAFRSRWSFQKGIDMILHAFRKYELYKRAQFVFVSRLDQVDPEYIGLWQELKGWSATFPHRIAFQPAESDTAGLQYAGSDMILMPSLYEPCGLVQMEAMRFGVVVIAHKTGGLADTINTRNGFVFDWPYRSLLNARQVEPAAGLMINRIYDALNLFHQSRNWKDRMKRVMDEDNSWNRRVQEYLSAYQHELNA